MGGLEHGAYTGGGKWPEAHSDMLGELHKEGVPFSEIARRINRKYGTAYSRNGAIGRANRMKLPPRAALSTGGRVTRVQRRAKAEPRASPQPVPKAPAEAKAGALAPEPLVARERAWRPLPGIPPLSRETAGRSHCQWPITVDGDDFSHCCGAVSTEGSYCKTHARMSAPVDGEKKKRAVDESHARAIFGARAA